METIDFSDIRPKGVSISTSDNRSPTEIMDSLQKIMEDMVISNHALTSKGMYFPHENENVKIFIESSKMTEEEIYRLGMNTGELFANKVDRLFEEFKVAYENADPNFDNEIYQDGFWKAFIDNVGYGIDYQR